MDKNIWKNNWIVYFKVIFIIFLIQEVGYSKEKKRSEVYLLSEMHLQDGDQQLECDGFTYWVEMPLIGIRNTFSLHVKIKKPQSFWRKEKYVQIYFPYSDRGKCEKYLWVLFQNKKTSLDVLLKSLKIEKYKVRVSLGSINLY